MLKAFEETVVGSLESWTDETGADRPRERNHAIGNVIVRLRMCCAYYAANRQRRLVLGTANRSELLLGYFTKYGDGAADTYPIGDFYRRYRTRTPTLEVGVVDKTEVRALAKRIGVPKRIVSKEPTAGFWAAQTDADELGATSDTIDPLLHQLVDENTSITDAADALGIDRRTARSLAWLRVETRHKRKLPQTHGIAGRPLV